MDPRWTKVHRPRPRSESRRPSPEWAAPRLEVAQPEAERFLKHEGYRPFDLKGLRFILMEASGLKVFN